MWLFDLFGKGGKEQQSENEKDQEAGSHEELRAYSGMRVEVTTFDGRLLFVAKLTNLWKNQANLEQFSEMELSQEELVQYSKMEFPQEDSEQPLEAETSEKEVEQTLETGASRTDSGQISEMGASRTDSEQPSEAVESEKEGGQPSETEDSQKVEMIHVRIRGYSDHERKAVYMEGLITPGDKRIWNVEDLKVAHIGNDRAFFRLDTDIEAVVTTFGGFSAGEETCRMLNISVGGARILSEQKYNEGDKFLLKVKLLEDRPMSVMFCEVLRIIEREDSKYEYGCRFLELNEEDQEKITQNIFAAQLAERRKKRGAS
ncbi:PilZ domain-containing protein [Schaedlerella arabinosiphila]|uniref:PilZ domain-containing protein n=1 Tax=Schaedlerella arabinosiphila TaxID=2044587 RepID=A0A426DN84_9FIRM|nr:PilZ domain-containing protein [Schaedlerella arabinosiphila]MCI9212667.1 PilZ domain-containing protein [Ruminococcus sp.]RRK34235.1 PilZ domain-containing protein [Schaedlerella arabinosiphila]